jgi:hypothetical protein
MDDIEAQVRLIGLLKTTPEDRGINKTERKRDFGFRPGVRRDP